MDRNRFAMNDFDKYISQFDSDFQSRLTYLRQLFFEIYPQSKECIRYDMLTYKARKHHSYFAAYKKHIGFYPVDGLGDLDVQLSQIRAKRTKASVHFMRNKPLLCELLRKIIKRKSELI